jgi:hypothetical protein
MSSISTYMYFHKANTVQRHMSTSLQHWRGKGHALTTNTSTCCIVRYDEEVVAYTVCGAARTNTAMQAAN